MNSLRDSLSSKGLRDLIFSQIQPGAVFFIPDHIANKNKFIVILGISADRIYVGTLFINSEVNENVIRTLGQRNLQYTLKASKYDFLDHDSYINASIIHKRDINDLIEIIIAINGEMRGNIETTEFDYIRSMMAESKLISKAEKKEFGLE